MHNTTHNVVSCSNIMLYNVGNKVTDTLPTVLAPYCATVLANRVSRLL